MGERESVLTCATIIWPSALVACRKRSAKLRPFSKIAKVFREKTVELALHRLTVADGAFRQYREREEDDGNN